MERIFTIVPENLDGTSYGNFEESQLVRASWCYLHGDLQNMVGYDIFYLVKSELMENEVDETNHLSDYFKEGIYPCKFDGKECTLFFWKTFKHRGLVVLNSDIEHYVHAKELFEEKSAFI